MRLVIAEKPSVARDIAQVLGVNSERSNRGYFEGKDGLRISWCVGHLVELQEPAHYDERWKAWSLSTLPMIPERFALRARVGGADRQWSIVESLLSDRALKEVVNACDAGREGELIFRYIYELAGCRAPVKRLWVSSMTDEAIRAAWANMQPSERYDPLADAARCRSEADWLVGMNATRAMTCLAKRQGMQALLSVGRVQTPTLSMIVERDHTIDNFTPQTFWQVKAQFRADVAPGSAGPSEWEATWFQPRADDGPTTPTPAPKAKAAAAPAAKGRAKKGDGPGAPDAPEEIPDDRIDNREAAEAIVKAITGREGFVTQATRKKSTEPPPLLYDLTSLQRRANQLYGLSASDTLEIAQALYEKHKLITYPRTDACYITPDQVPTLEGVLKAVGGVPEYGRFTAPLLTQPIKPGKRVVNAEEVGDHHAILPTDRKPRLDKLNENERRIYDLVSRRLIAVLSADAVFDVTTLVVSVGKKTDKLAVPAAIEVPLKFRARGRICRVQGWRAVDPAPGKGKDMDLPVVERGDRVTTASARTHEGKTRPPSPYNDASILLSMETAGRQLEDAELKRTMRNSGLGTPATRAAVLQTLIDRGFVVRDGRYLKSTAAGQGLINAVPIEELKSAQLTAQWEARLSAMADGKESRKAFIHDVGEHVQALVERLKRAVIPAGSLPKTDPSQQRPHVIPDSAPLGPCPICKTSVREGVKAYSCEQGRACQFVVFKVMAQRPITADEVTQLLTQGYTDPLEGFKSKAGRDFAAALAWDAEQNKVIFRFADGPAPSSAVPSAAPAKKEIAPGDTCPMCGEGHAIKGRAALGCSRWREGCGWRQPFEAA